MPKNLALILGASIVVIIIAVLAYTMVSKSSKTGQAPTTAESTQPQQATRGSIKSLLGMGKSETCDIVYPDGNGKGTIYVVDKKMRGDFTTMVNNQSMENHMIQDGDYVYFWSGTQGTKMKVSTIATPTPGATVGQQPQGADLNKDVDYKCSSWSVDNSKLTPPADVKFTDLTQMMTPQQTKSSPQTGGTNSSYCNPLTDPAAKAACINAGSGY